MYLVTCSHNHMSRRLHTASRFLSLCCVSSSLIINQKRLNRNSLQRSKVSSRLSGEEPEMTPSIFPLLWWNHSLPPFIHLPSSSERRHKSLSLAAAEVALMILMRSGVCCPHVSKERTHRHHSLWLINPEIPNHLSHFTRAWLFFSI